MHFFCIFMQLNIYALFLHIYAKSARSRQCKVNNRWPKRCKLSCTQLGTKWQVFFTPGRRPGASAKSTTDGPKGANKLPRNFPQTVQSSLQPVAGAKV
jgi:hypothetical protein